jgi:hypothetical protein
MATTNCADGERRKGHKACVCRNDVCNILGFQESDFQVSVRDASQKLLFTGTYSEPVKLKPGDYHIVVSKADYLDYNLLVSVMGNVNERIYLYPRNAVKTLIPSLSIKYPESFMITQWRITSIH